LQVVLNTITQALQAAQADLQQTNLVKIASVLTLEHPVTRCHKDVDSAVTL
jgi:hypothetical protein